jgi:hypothetical protein
MTEITKVAARVAKKAGYNLEELHALRRDAWKAVWQPVADKPDVLEELRAWRWYRGDAAKLAAAKEAQREGRRLARVGRATQAEAAEFPAPRLWIGSVRGL